MFLDNFMGFGGVTDSTYVYVVVHQPTLSGSVRQVLRYGGGVDEQVFAAKSSVQHASVFAVGSSSSPTVDSHTNQGGMDAMLLRMSDSGTNVSMTGAVFVGGPSDEQFNGVSVSDAYDIVWAVGTTSGDIPMYMQVMANSISAMLVVRYKASDMSVGFVRIVELDSNRFTERGLAIAADMTLNRVYVTGERYSSGEVDYILAVLDATTGNLVDFTEAHSALDTSYTGVYVDTNTHSVFTTGRQDTSSQTYALFEVHCGVDDFRYSMCECPINSYGDGCATSLCANPNVFGANCNQSLCDSDPCINGGTCISESLVSFVCACKTNYGGSQCQLSCDVCGTNSTGCAFTDDGQVVCICDPGHTGDRCQDSACSSDCGTLGVCSSYRSCSLASSKIIWGLGKTLNSGDRYFSYLAPTSLAETNEIFVVNSLGADVMWNGILISEPNAFFFYVNTQTGVAANVSESLMPSQVPHSAIGVAVRHHLSTTNQYVLTTTIFGKNYGNVALVDTVTRQDSVSANMYAIVFFVCVSLSHTQANLPLLPSRLLFLVQRLLASL